MVGRARVLRVFVAGWDFSRGALVVLVGFSAGVYVVSVFVSRRESDKK